MDKIKEQFKYIMAKVVYYTQKYKKEILDGQAYVAVTVDGQIMNTIARANVPADPSIVARFLSKSGADKFLLTYKPKAVIKAPVVKVAPIKSPEEIEEERLAALNPWEQLDTVEDKAGFNKWLKRNKFRVTKSDGDLDAGESGFLKVSSTTSEFISFSWSIGAVAYCCGGREHGSHSGGVNSSYSQKMTNARLGILATYLVEDFEKACGYKSNNNRTKGLISYIVKPDSISHSSARIGFLFAASDKFIKTGRFNNSNGGNTLDLYAITDEWSK